MAWNLSKGGIEEWMQIKEDKFAQQETRCLHINHEKWKHRYTYFDLNEIMFGDFSRLLREWVKRQNEINITW